MSAPVGRSAAAELSGVRTLLCDADDCLFPSERPAFEASTEVTNRLLAHLEVPVSFSPDALRRTAAGRNFRANARELALAHGVELAADELERWVQEERRAVTAHLADVLRPDPDVLDAVTDLAERFSLAVVSSSAASRLDACFAVTGLDDLFPKARRFSAEDSLPVPTSKPDPAVYAFAGRRLGVARGQALAVEDSVAGARSAVAAGFPCVGNLAFVVPEEREERAEALRAAGAVAVVPSWHALGELLPGAVRAGS